MKTKVLVSVEVPSELFTYDLGGEFISCAACKGIQQLDLDHREMMRPN